MFALVKLSTVLLTLLAFAVQPGGDYPALQDEEDIEEIGYADIAAVYYYGGGDTRIHTWISDGNGFKYSGSNGWFSTKRGGYEGNRLAHCVAGDWNGDGYTDMAGFYDYGEALTRIHVWLNKNGQTFDYQKSRGWWESNKGGYDAQKIADAAAGDFNGDGYDDIATFYDYGNDETRIHIWLSNGTDAFTYQSSRGWWSARGYTAKNIRGAVAGELGD